MFTILGHSGFIGSRLAGALEAAGEKVFRPRRDLDDIDAGNLGHIIDCVGNDRGALDPFGVVNAHVLVLQRILEHQKFSSYLYLSTTRVYQESNATLEESDINVAWLDSQRLFILSKMVGESLCLVQQRPTIRVVRLSNVYGCNPNSHYFLPSLIRDALVSGQLELCITPQSSKDYISVDDVVAVLPRISQMGQERLYNLASGRNVGAGTIVASVQKQTGAAARWHAGAPFVSAEPIVVDRIVQEFNIRFRSVLEDMPELVGETRQLLAV